ncbi:uncharacterized protein [Rutidosis leptorrhynchoides]|uniref:uncharacterized protein n=1 Tax=Rutidosis leptorrhynchoides TaxID=125765 RepID=UPI003A9A597E
MPSGIKMVKEGFCSVSVLLFSVEFLFKMKIVSYNIRGFGSGKFSKFNTVKKLIANEKPSFCALQETKLRIVKDSWVHKLWGSTECDFIQQEMIGKSGGQLLIWDLNVFEPIDVHKVDRVIGIRGKWKSSGIEINILNVYGPYDDNSKQNLWDNLTVLLRDSNEPWVICGDFNEVRDQSERLNCEFVESRAKRFNNFIQSNDLMDIPLGDITVVALERKDSDHCPIVLKDSEKDFSPKPFKLFDAWFNENGFEQVIMDAWENSEQTGTRKDKCFLNKLKVVKIALRSWSSSNYGQLDGDIEVLKNLAQNLELKAETCQLNNSELESWNKARKEWIDKENIKISMLKQKPRVRWVLEGDENTKYFHSFIRNNYNRCNIRGLTINGS